MNPNTTLESKYKNSWALIIGIDKYIKASPLAHATKDASAFAQALMQRFSFPETNITLLLDEEATRDAVRKAYIQYKRTTQPDDRLVVFFAGHGHTEIGVRGEVGYLVPVDGDAAQDETLIRWDEFTKYTDLIPAKHIFFLMDACYGGTALMRNPSFGVMRFLRDMLKRRARQVLTAGKADETVSDGNGVRSGHSIFTAHLLNALDGDAATSDGILTASSVMAYVYDHVAKDQYSNQTPHFGFIDGDGDFIFDTTPLEALLKSSSQNLEKNPKGEQGETDVLVNTSAPVPSVLPAVLPVLSQMKSMLSDQSKRIELDDFINSHITKFLDLSDLRHYPVQGVPAQQNEFVQRIQSYETIVKDLQAILVLLAKWGDKNQAPLIEDTIRRLAEADKGSDGTVLWLRLTWYPIVMLLYTVGIVAIFKKKYDVLRYVIDAKVHTERGSVPKVEPIIVPALSNISDLPDSFKWLPGRERNYVPRSEHLFKILQPIIEDNLFIGKEYEATFDKFEIILALAYSYATERGWGPPGRFAWKEHRGYGEKPYDQLVEEARREGNSWGPIRAGLFGSSIDKFLNYAESYGKDIAKLAWW